MRSLPKLSRRAFVLTVASTGTAALAVLGGCYKHVVGARGFGADESMRIHEPNAPDDSAKTTRTLPSERRGTRRR